MRVFVVGGTGFIGRPVVEALLAHKHKVVALARTADDLRDVPGIEVVKGDFRAPMTYRGHALGCDASIHLVGLLKASRAKFERVVVNGTKAWVKECQEAGVKHLVYVSAIGAAPDGTIYQRSKWAAEQAVRNSGLAHTIFRPSFVIGPGGFLQEMDRMLALRIMPVFGEQDYLATPVARDDLVQAIVASVGHPKARNRVFHIGGPDTLTYLQMLRTIRDAGGRRAALPRLPKWMGFLAAALLGWLPFFPANRDNLRMLFQGNVAPEHEWETVFGIRARSFERATKDAMAALRQA